MGGEVDALDPGAYGSFRITQAITIEGQGWSYVAPPDNGHAITIDAFGGGTVAIHGVSLNGVGTTNTTGILYEAGDRVEIADCVVRNFALDGINLNVGAGLSGVRTFIVSNTVASGNGSAGIEIAPQSFFALRGALDNVTTAHNALSGILINATNATNGGFVDIAISNSISESNSDSGVTVQGLGNAKVEIKNATLSNNVNNGLAVSNARVGLSTSSLVLNGAGFSNTNSGTIFSFVDNIIENNRDPNTGTLTTATRQ